MQDRSQARQYVNHRIPDIDATEDGQALLTKGTCETEIAFAVGREGEIVQRKPLAQRLAQLAEDGKAFLAAVSRIGRLPKIPRDVAEDHQRDRRAASVHRRPVEDQRFLGEGSRSLVIPELARCPAEITE